MDAPQVRRVGCTKEMQLECHAWKPENAI